MNNPDIRQHIFSYLRQDPFPHSPEQHLQSLYATNPTAHWQTELLKYEMTPQPQPPYGTMRVPLDTYNYYDSIVQGETRRHRQRTAEIERRQRQGLDEAHPDDRYDPRNDHYFDKDVDSKTYRRFIPDLTVPVFQMLAEAKRNPDYRRRLQDAVQTRDRLHDAMRMM